MTRPAVFLDRDGTIIEEVGYPSRPGDIRILPGAARGLARLAAAGHALVVVTNQSGIARGKFTEADLDRFHEALDEQLDVLGARVDAWYSCPHHPDAAVAVRADLAVECDCRKPKPGMILRAADDLGLDLAASWLVGDTWRDIAAGQAAGVRTIKVPAPPSHDAPRPAGVDPPTAQAPTLDAAASLILAEPAETPPEPEPEPTPVPGPEPATPEPEPEPEPPVARPPQPAPAVPVETPVETVACGRCGRPLDPTEDAVVRDGPPFCPECAALQVAEPTREDDVAATLRSIQAELRRLVRRREGGGLSMLRLLAYLVQVAAVVAVVAGLAVQDSSLRATLLPLAVFMQALVVTLLVLEGKP